MMESYTKAEALLQEPDISLKEIQKEAESLISLSLRGLRCKSCKTFQTHSGLRNWGLDLHAYDWLLLRVVVVCGYLSWIATTASFILRHYVFQHSKQLSLPPRGYTWCTLSIWALATVLFAKFAQEQAPASYYLYTAGSAYLLALAVSDLQPLLLLLKLAGSQPMSSAMVGAALLLGLECMVFGYFERQSWTMGLAFCGLSGWYWCPSKPKATLWTFVCLATGAFTLLPVEKGESLWCLSVCLFHSHTFGDFVLTLSVATALLVDCCSSWLHILTSRWVKACTSVQLFGFRYSAQIVTQITED